MFTSVSYRTQLKFRAIKIRCLAQLEVFCVYHRGFPLLDIQKQKVRIHSLVSVAQNPFLTFRSSNWAMSTRLELG